MKKHVILTCTLALFLLFFSCETKEAQSENSIKVYEWTPVDSLDLQFLGAPSLTDVSSSGDKLLFFDYPSKEIIIAEGDGAIVQTFSKNEDTPDAYGFMLESPGFYSDSLVAVFGMNGLFVFDLAGTMKKKIPHPESLSGAGSVNSVGKSIESVVINNRAYLLPKSVRPRNSFAGEQEFYDTYRAVELVDVDAGSMTEMIPFEPGSHFLNGRGYIQSDYTPGYEAADEKLYIVHGGDPQLYVYLLDGTTAQLDTVIQLDIPGFRIPEGKDRKEFQEGHVEIQAGSASVRNIHIIGDLLLLNYYSGTDPKKAEEVRALRQEGKDDEAVALSNKSREETPNGTLVYSLSELSYLGHASPPAQKTSSTYVSGGGFAWFQKTPDPEVEEDFLRIYKMKLVAK